MPPLVNQPNVLKYELEFAAGTDIKILSRLYFTWAGTAPTTAALNALAQTADSYASTNFPQLMDPTRSYQGLNITDLTSPTAAYGAHATPNNGNGPGTPPPANSCVLMNMVIARRYRGGKPRVYWPFGLSAQVATAQTWSTSFLTLCHTQVAGFIAAVLASSSGGTTVSNLVNVSYYEGFTTVTNAATGRTKDVPKPRTTAIPPDVVVGWSLNTKIGSQRRRIAA